MPLIDPDLPRLTKRKLFDVRDDSPHVLLVGSFGDWHTYAFGYKNAADVVVERLVKLHRVSEVAVLAVLFLYRHYVELSLKGMLLDAGELLRQDEQAPIGHPLTPLWMKLRDRLNKIERQNDPEWLDRAETLIREFDSLDYSSYTFRYPVDKKGAPNSPPSRTVDIDHFRKVMDELEMVLGGIAAWLDNYVGIKREMDAEFRDSY